MPEETPPLSPDAPAVAQGSWADRGWWLAVEYGVLAKQDRFEKKLAKLRTLGSMKELLEPGGKILYRNLFRENEVRQAWSLVCELEPWSSKLKIYLSGVELGWKDAQDILWCAGFLAKERPCRGDPESKGGKDRRGKPWVVGCDRRVSLAAGGWDQDEGDRRHLLTFAKVDARGVLGFDRDAIAAFLRDGPLNGRCPLSPARDPVALAAVFRDVSVRALGWPLVLEMTAELKRSVGNAALEAEHGFVLKKGLALEEHEPIELRWAGGEVEVRRVRDLKAGGIARQVRLPKRVQGILEGGARLRGVRLEEGYVRMAELGGRYEVEQRFVLATRFHLGLEDDAARYEGHEPGTVPSATPEWERWARQVLEEVP